MRCPFCDEDVRDGAPVCRHCGNDLKIPESLKAEKTSGLERENSSRHTSRTHPSGINRLAANKCAPSPDSRDK